MKEMGSHHFYFFSINVLSYGEMNLLRGRFPQWGSRIRIPLALFVVVLLSYGLWIPWLGMYGNDLPYLWYYHLLGPWGPGEFVAIDRPASALFYAAVTLTLGENAWLYHGLLLVLRWLSGVLLWGLMRLAWPERGREAAAAGALFVVYPGFRQSPVAVEFILHLAVLNLFLLSMVTMLLAAIRPRRQLLWRMLSLITAAGPVFLEYFIGLEALRPVFLWLITRRQGLAGKKQWERIVSSWAPALGVVLAFFIWRVFIFSFRTYQPVLLEELRAAPALALLDLGARIVRDLWTSLIAAWKLVFQLPQNSRWLAQSLLLSGVCAGVLFLLFWRTRRLPAQPLTHDGRGNDYWAELVLGLGLFAMLAGGAVFWVTGIPISVDFPWDRSTLSLMLGASLVAVGLLNMLVAQRYRLLILSIMIGLAAGAHYQNAQVYRAEWKKLQSFIWQLTWRAPGFEPGTLILFDAIPLNRYSDSDLTALLNWTYAPDWNTRQIPYKFFDLTIRLDGEHGGLPALEKGLPVEHNHRGMIFRTTTSRTLAIHYDPPGCLVVLNAEDPVLPGLPGRLPDALAITDINQIRVDADPAVPPQPVGAEPAHDWCYYYQKAELGRQKEDWRAVAELGDQAEQDGFTRNDPAELLPFAEGYACAGNLEKARQLTIEISQEPGLRPSLCATWTAMCGGKQAPELQAAMVEMQAELGCQTD